MSPAKALALSNAFRLNKPMEYRLNWNLNAIHDRRIRMNMSRSRSGTGICSGVSWLKGVNLTLFRRCFCELPALLLNPGCMLLISGSEFLFANPMSECG